MTHQPGSRPRFRLPWLTRAQIEADVDEELAFHLEMRARELVARGVPDAMAHDEARRQFGDLDFTRHYCRDEDRSRERERRRMTRFDELRQDLSYAVRALRAARGFAVVTLLTLAVGIGANTAIFSVVRGVLLQPLPFANADQLDRIRSKSTTADEAASPLSEPDFLDVRAASRSYVSMAGYFYMEGNSGKDLTGAGTPEYLQSAMVTDRFFETLGTPAWLGRWISQEESDGKVPVVVLSHGLWQRRFGADRGIVGRAITLGGVPHTVVGVMPPQFTYPADRMDVWIPLSTVPPDDIGRARFARFLAVIGRRAPAVSPEQAKDELAAIARRLAAQYPENADWKSFEVQSLRESLLGEVQRPLLVLLGAVAFLLLMTCANVAGLLLARASTRERELAVRAALGAGRGRIVRQLLTESLVLALAGGVLGVLLALAGVKVLVQLAAAELPRLDEVRVDGTVLLFSLVASLLAGLIFGLTPALRAARTDLREGLHAGGRGNTSAAGQRLRAALVVVQVAVALVLAIGAGLATTSVSRLLDVDPGFRPANILTVTFSLDGDRYPDRGAQYLSVLERIRAVPGVVSVGAAKDLPLRGAGENAGVKVVGGSVPADQEQRPALNMVSPDYFRTLGVPLKAGRDFTPADRSGAPLVFIVNEALARKYWPGQDAIGKLLDIGNGTQVPVVGVVGDVRQRSLAEPPEPTIYTSNMQIGRSRTSTAIRTSGEPLRMANSVIDAIRSTDRELTIRSVASMDDVVRSTVARPRLIASLLVLFGLMGLALGALGLHGVLAYAVSQRRQEIGVRVALGATPAKVLRMVVTQGLALAAIGVTIGVVAALLVTRYMSGLLFGVGATDPVTFVAVAGTLLLVALAATLVPARRAVRIPPMIAMRAE